MAYDKLCNLLKVGDLVKVDNLGDIFGEISEVHDGSLVGANQMVLPAKLRITVDITLGDNSGKGVYPAVLKVYNPKQNEPRNNA